MGINFFANLFFKEIAVNGENLVLRKPSTKDFSQWLALRTESETFLRQWEPKWPKDDLSEAGYQLRLKTYRIGFKHGDAQTYFLHDLNAGQLVGGLSLTRITRVKDNASALLGYWMGEPFANQGYMQKAVPRILRHAFETLGLETINAAVLPRNKRSIHLLRKCGFREFDFREKYLEINGVKEDHLIFSIENQKFYTNK